MHEARRVIDKAIDEAVMRRAAELGLEAPPNATEAAGAAALLGFIDAGEN